MAGSVTDIYIARNHVSRRGDAGIALTSEEGYGGRAFILSGALVENNELVECRVGLDNSGATNAVWRNNSAVASVPTSTSNPAFRSIPYPPGTPVVPFNISVLYNVCQNGKSSVGENAAKVDAESKSGVGSTIFVGNTFGALSAGSLSLLRPIIHVG